MIELAEIDARNLPDEGDPLVWLNKHREKLSKKYPSVEALFEYYKQFNSVEDALVQVRAKIAEKKKKAQMM